MLENIPEEEKQKRLNAIRELSELADTYRQAMEEERKKQEQYWDSLTPEQQLDAFCCIVRRIVKGELDEQGSYRYVLYNVFGWGPEAYATALDAGYMNLHNSIYPDGHDENLINSFCKFMKLEVEEDKIEKFLRNPHNVT